MNLKLKSPMEKDSTNYYKMNSSNDLIYQNFYLFFKNYSNLNFVLISFH